MRFRLIVLWLVMLAMPSLAQDSWSPGTGWKQEWADEFNGTNVDAAHWSFDLGGNGWGNQELQVYTKTNASLQDGALVITALQHGTNSYTSARMKTQGKHSWQGGKIAARIQLPRGQGIWPAFWLLGDSISTIGWPKCGEIDIMEMIGGGEDRDDTVHGTIHWHQENGHKFVGGARELPDPKAFHEAYHVFEVEWDREQIVWKLDGAEYYRTGVARDGFPEREEFHQPFFIILNLAVGGRWPGYPDRTTSFPQQMWVDWVRVYQRASSS